MKDFIARLYKTSSLFLVALLFVSLISCSEDDSTEPSIDESAILIEYLEGTAGDFINTAAPAMKTATDIYTNISANADVAVLDIRAAADFEKGRIPNAVNVTLAEIVNYYKTNNLASKEAVYVACYTGQTASFATSLLRLLGYSNTWTLKFGMSSWNEEFSASWDGAISNGKAAQFVTDATAKGAAVSMPTLSTGLSDPAAILEARVNALLTEGFGVASIANADVFAALDNYYIVNYWPENHYSLGHIPGAMQYTPKADLKSATFLKTLPTDKDVVVYCYTGQTSAFVTAFLRVLGYNAKSLKFGTNAMIYDLMVTNSMTIWDKEHYCMNYEFEK